MEENTKKIIYDNAFAFGLDITGVVNCINWVVENGKEGKKLPTIELSHLSKPVKSKKALYKELEKGLGKTALTFFTMDGIKTMQKSINISMLQFLEIEGTLDTNYESFMEEYKAMQSVHLKEIEKLHKYLLREKAKQNKVNK